MQIPFLLTADYANGAGNNKLNVMGIFGTIFSRKFPTVHSIMFVVFKLVASPSEYDTTRKITVLLIDEDGRNELVRVEADIHITRPKEGGNVEISQALQLQNVLFPEPGEYQVAILVDNDEKATLALKLVLIPDQDD